MHTAEKGSDYKEVAAYEMARRRTAEKMQAAFGRTNVAGQRALIEQAQEYYSINKGSKDPEVKGKIAGYRDFVKTVR